MSAPRGLILLWHGAIVDIPAGYALCNGDGETPDLRDKFIVGAGDTYNPGNTGGATEHAHLFTGDGHTHDIGGGLEISAGANFSDTTDSAAATGLAELEPSMPPWYSLAFIMKT